MSSRLKSQNKLNLNIYNILNWKEHKFAIKHEWIRYLRYVQMGISKGLISFQHSLCQQQNNILTWRSTHIFLSVKRKTHT